MERSPRRKKRKEKDRPRNQDPSHGGRGEGGLDHISGLPDCVLGAIVSLLPTSDGARTQIHSPLWRHVWRSAPLNLDCHGFGARAASLNLMRRVRSAHRGQVRRLILSTIRNPGVHPQMDSFLEATSLDNLQELEFFYSRRQPMATNPGWRPPFPLPARRFASTLRVASFGFCHFPEETATSLRFPVLKQLELREVSICEAPLHSLLAGCPSLESLLLALNIGFRRFRIISPSLRSIGVWADGRDVTLEELIVEDAPCLERLLFPFGCRLHISVIAAPKLEVLGWISEFRLGLRLGIAVPRELNTNIVSLTAAVRTMNIVSLITTNFSLDVVVNLMTCFPCLKNLHVSSVNTREVVQNECNQEYQGRVECVNHHLKKVVLTGYLGNLSHVNFAKFFVLNARVLESMRFQIQEESAEWIGRQRQLLQLKDRASSDAKFDFVSEKWLCCTLDMKKVSDFSKADPFSLSCRDCI